MPVPTTPEARAQKKADRLAAQGYTASEASRLLRAEAGKHAWLPGGGPLAKALRSVAHKLTT